MCKPARRQAPGNAPAVARALTHCLVGALLAVGVAGLRVSAAAAHASAELVCRFAFDQDQDGDGVADDWELIRAEQTKAWLDSEVKVQGSAAQGVSTTTRFGGPWSHPLHIDREGFYRLSFRVKVKRGQVKVHGQGQLVWCGWGEIYDPENAGDWRQVTRLFRRSPWHGAPTGGNRFWAYAESKDGAEFWVDDMKIERLAHDPDRPALSEAELTLPASPVSASKKLIGCGNDAPLTSYVREHIRQMERAPYDGIVMKLTRSSTHDFFSHSKIPDEAAERAIADLKATEFRKFKHNFLWANAIVDGSKAHPDYHGDWFKDANWDAKLHNARLFARVSAEGGLKGIMFDTEMYCGQVFDYGFQKDRDKIGFAAYQQQVRERGRQFIRAINGACPQIEIIFMVTAWHNYMRYWTDPQWPEERMCYGLFPAFMDGIMDAATPETKLVDGFEEGYNLTEYADFALARGIIRDGVARFSSDPARYRDRIRAGFGIGLIYHEPDVKEDAIYYALHAADEYVWIWYGWSYNFWLGSAPRARVAALMNAKKARNSPDRLSADDLPDYWTHRTAEHFAAELAERGYSRLDAKFGYRDHDPDPAAGAVGFGWAGALALDYDMRSIGVDLGTAQRVDLVQVYGSPAGASTGRLDKSSVEVYVSDDNQAYRPVAFTYREPFPTVIEVSDLNVTARYVKIHCSITDKKDAQFTAGTDYGPGAYAFRRR